MSSRIPKIVAVTSVAAAMAVGGAGIAQASPGSSQGKDQSAKTSYSKDRRSSDGNRSRDRHRGDRHSRDRHRDRHDGGRDRDGDGSRS